MIRKILLSAAFICLSAISAAGADLSNRALPSATPIWSGFYLGVHGSLASGRTEINALSSFGFAEGWDVSGGTIGLQAGYNSQFQALVLGIEAEYAYAHIEGSAYGSMSYYTGSPFQTDLTSRVDIAIHQLAIIRPRIGVAFGNSLIYATVGVVASDFEARSETSQTSRLGGTRAYSSRNRNIVYGWALGAGLEHALNEDWSLKGEYLLVTLDRNSQGELVENNLYQGHLGRIGLNYKF